MGVYLARPVTNVQRKDGAGPGRLRYGVASMQGWRLSQEDAHLALPNFDPSRGIALFAVFDGHCGGAVLSLVANWLPEKLRSAKAYKSGNYPLALKQAFLAMDRHLDSRVGRLEMRAEAERIRKALAPGFSIEGKLDEEDIQRALAELCEDNPDSTGCTAVVALLEYRSGSGSGYSRVHVANCGDSRCVLWDQRGRCLAMSKDHKPTHQLERKRVEAAGGCVTSEGRINGNLNLSRALADFEYKKTRKRQALEKQMISGVPDVRSKVLRSRDRYLLLACDGVWETRRSSQATIDLARRCLSGGTNGRLSAGLGRLLKETLAKDDSCVYGRDNMTAVLVELPAISAGKRSPHAPRTPGRFGSCGVRKTILKRPSLKQ